MQLLLHRREACAELHVRLRRALQLLLLRGKPREELRV
jgi:hypothetical protein